MFDKSKLSKKQSLYIRNVFKFFNCSRGLKSRIWLISASSGLIIFDESSLKIKTSILLNLAIFQGHLMKLLPLKLF